MKALKALLKKRTAKEELNLSNNKINDDVANELAKLSSNNSITSLNLASKLITSKEIEAIMQELSKNKRVTELDLKWNGSLGDGGAKELANGLITNEALTSLNLRVCQIHDEGTIALSEGLRKYSYLTSLSLEANQIGAEGVKSLAKALEENIRLRVLNLWACEIGDEGAKEIAKSLERNNILTSLDLGENYICKEGIKALAEGLAKNNSLLTLNLGCNSIGDEGAKYIIEALTNNITLRHLFLEDTGISYELRNQIPIIIAARNEYIQKLQLAALNLLKNARIMLYQVVSIDSVSNVFIKLPLEIKEEIVKIVNKNSYLNNEQQLLILDYAEGKIAPVADKLSFFKVTECDRVRKQPSTDEVEAATRSLSFMV